MDLNEQIFDSVKKVFEEDQELLLKICTGQTTEGIPKDLEKQIQDSCRLGYNYASKFDQEERIFEELKNLNHKIDYLIQKMEEKDV